VLCFKNIVLCFKNIVLFQKHCVVFQELFVVFADMGNRSYWHFCFQKIASILQENHSEFDLVYSATTQTGPTCYVSPSEGKHDRKWDSST